MKKNLLHRSLSRGVTSGGSSSGSYTVNLNGQWEQTTAVSNPDSSVYDGVFRSASNYNVNSRVATMYITIKDCSSFRLYIRSYAESNYDYVMVSQLDQTITGSTSYSNTTLVKAHTRGNQLSGTAIGNYTLVEFIGISSGEHTITIIYRKDSSVNKNDDRGYVLIDKSSVNSGDEGGSNEGPIDIANYLTIEALENGLTASLSKNACEYCVDGDGNWLTIAAGTSTESINIGQTLSFRGNLQPNSSSGIGTFKISKKCNLIGNCMSMLFGNNAAYNTSFNDNMTNAFYRLFYKCSNIVTVSSNFLPATTLADFCYSTMFYGCTSLTTVPELPATTLADYCYDDMFSGCTSLVNAPELPATTLANYCYSSMFYGCTSLVNAPELPATTLKNGCYKHMFSYCTSLTTAPALPATTFAYLCYYGMFYNTNVLPDCSNIDFTSSKVIYTGVLGGLFAGTKVTDNDLFNLLPINSNGKYYLPATTLADNCYDGMFAGCTSLTTAPELPATILTRYCYYLMFSDCTSLTTAPELPATTLVNYCYTLMFSNCSKLNYIKMLATDISANNCLASWVYNVAPTGTFVKHPDMTTLPTSEHGIPSGWTVLDATS